MFSFREVQVSDAKLILDWRTKDRVTRFMNSDVNYDIKSQEAWLKNSYSKLDYYHWIVQYLGRDVGLIYFSDFNPVKKETSWGFYLGVDDALGIGGMLPPFFYNFAFRDLGVEQIKAEVFYNNLSAIQLHLMQGYEFDPSRDHVIEKNCEQILIVCLVLNKQTFLTSKYSRLKADLPTENWDYSDKIRSND